MADCGDAKRSVFRYPPSESINETRNCSGRSRTVPQSQAHSKLWTRKCRPPQAWYQAVANRSFEKVRFHSRAGGARVFPVLTRRFPLAEKKWGGRPRWIPTIAGMAGDDSYFDVGPCPGAQCVPAGFQTQTDCLWAISDRRPGNHAEMACMQLGVMHTIKRPNWMTRPGPPAITKVRAQAGRSSVVSPTPVEENRKARLEKPVIRYSRIANGESSTETVMTV